MRAGFEDAGICGYRLNGVPMYIQESWRRYQQAPSEWWISSERKAGGAETAENVMLESDGLSQQRSEITNQ